MSIRSVTRLMAVVLALACLSPAAQAEIRPLTMRDAVGMSTFGAASIDPTGRWAVYEKRGPYDTAASYDRLLRSNWSITDLRIASTDASGAVERLLPDGEGVGLLLGAWSPAGDWLLIYRLRDDRLEPGVVKVADRSVWWTGLAAEWGVTGAVAAWIDDDHLGLTIHPGGELAYLLRQPGSVQRAMPGRWATQKAGRAPTRTIVDTDGGVAISDAPEPANAVVSLDVRRRTTATLTEGLVRDWAVSPDGRTLAVVKAGEGLPFEPDRLAQLAPLERGRLELVDIPTGRRRALGGDRDVAGQLLRWSAASDALLVWARKDGSAWAQGELARVTPEGVLTVIPRGALAPLRPGGDIDALSGVRADWMGSVPVLYARDGTGTRFDWWALDEGRAPRVLTAAMRTPAARVSAVDGDHLLLFADGGLWTAGGVEAEKLSAPGITVSDARRPDRMAPVRLRVNTPPRRDWVVALDAEGRISRIDARGTVVDLGPTDPSAENLMLGAEGAAAVVLARDHGVETLSLDHAGAKRDLDRVNAEFADLALARPVAVHHRTTAGAEATSWLFLPPHPAMPIKGIVVLAYPGSIEDGRGVSLESLLFGPRPAMLAAEGYAVLSPEIPVSARGGGTIADFEAAIDLAVDAMAAGWPGLPLDRMALLGHSFGGHMVLSIAERSSRYRSYIVWAGLSDIFGAYGEFTPQNRAAPEDGFTLRQQMGWAESNQAELAGPPWKDPQAYLAMSPFMAADRIQAPLLLIAADLDFVPLSQAERMFSALNRTGGRARLVTYWGEWHNNTSPANIVDVYDQITRWLEETLTAPVRNGRDGAALPSAEPSPRSSPSP